jgi:Erv1 / Alr family
MPLSMPPEVWGPIFWATIHITALAYPETPNYSQKRAAKDFYKSLGELIPCPICRKHFIENIKQTPIDPFLDNRTDLVNWTLKLHNKVNLDLGKATITREEFMKAYEDMCDRGLPIPPSPYIHKIYESADERSYAKGVMAGAVGALGAAGLAYGIYKSYLAM